MSALVNENTASSVQSPVTAISALARVDYILRFSKHAVILIDEQSDVTAAIGTQYLANLSAEHNAAYLAMSPRLDDVQVRCRIVEQLFGHVLFDPEQSVAVSLVNLLKQNKLPISVVVENAELLSIQLLSELTQLAEIGRKAKYSIEVVLLAKPEIGQKMALHPAMFNKKLSIVRASNGQLVALSSKIFGQKKRWYNHQSARNWILFFAVLILGAAAAIYSLYKMESFTFSQVEQKPSDLVAEQSKSTSENSVLQSEKTQATIFEPLTEAESEESSATLPVEVANAEPKDILLALSNVASNVEDIAEPDTVTEAAIASSTEVNQALNLSLNLVEQRAEPEQTVSVQPAPVAVVDTIPESETETKVLSNVQGSGITYQVNGFVVQLGAFAQQPVLNQLKAQINSVETLQYQRLMYGSKQTVLTSAVFASRDEAQAFIDALPTAGLTSSPFIKTTDAIKQEIKTIQSSQSQ